MEEKDDSRHQQYRSPVTGRYEKEPGAHAAPAVVPAAAPAPPPPSAAAAPSRADTAPPSRSDTMRIIIASIMSVIFAVGIAIGIYLMIPKNYSVKFFGLENTVVNEISVRGRKKLKPNDIPQQYIGLKEKEGYEFTGWYQDIARTEAFSTEKQKIKKNTSLYGSFREAWAVEPAFARLTYNGEPQAPDIAPSGNYTVRYYYNEACTAEISGQKAKDAGTYYAKLSLTDPSLFKWVGDREEDIVRAWTIDPAHLTVTAGAQTKEYGDSEPALTYEAYGWQGTDGVTLMTGGLIREAGENAGTYAIGIGDLAAGSNYTVDCTGADFTITKAELTVTVTPGQKKVYGDDDPEFKYTESGWKSDDESNSGGILTGALARAAGQQNVGTYAIQRGTLSAGTNYEIKFVPASFAITATPLTVTAHAKTMVYGGLEPALTYTAVGWKYNDEFNSTGILAGGLTRASGTGVGAYAITQGTLGAGGNYAVNFTGADFTITKAELTVTAHAKTMVYGGSEPALTYTASGWAGGENEGLLNGALSRLSGLNAGIYAILRGTLSETSGNYNVVFVGADFTITPAPLTVTAHAKTMVYGGSEPLLTYTAAGWKSGDESNSTGILVGGLSRESGQDVGAYKIQKGSLEIAGGNYEIVFTSADFVITRKTVASADVGVDLAINAISLFIYSGAPCTPAPSMTYNGHALVSGVDFDYGYASNTNAGKAEVTVTFKGNYDGFVKVDFIIAPALLTVTADAQTKVYGQSDPAFTFIPTGLVNGETALTALTGALTRADITNQNAGTYEILRGTLNAANYDITFTNGVLLTITKKTLTVTADAQTKVYGQSDPAFTFTANSFVYGETALTALTGTLTRADITNQNAGTYEILRGTLNAANYEITFTGGVLLTITKKTLTVTPDSNQTKIYGQSDPAFTFTSNGFVYGETAGAALTGALTRAGITNQNAGTYEILRGTLNAANYEITFTGGVLFEITKAPLTITVITGQSKIYDNDSTSDPEFDFDATGLTNGDTKAVFTGRLGRTAGELVGFYPINIGNLSAGNNYEITVFIAANFEITDIDRIAKLGSIADLIYNGTGQNPGVSNAGYTVTYHADALCLTAPISGAKDAGTYYAKLTLNPGYGWSDGGAEAYIILPWKINKAGLTVAVTPGQTKEYGDSEPAEFAFTASGWFEDDDEYLLGGALIRAAGENIGSYAILQGTLFDTSGNYNIIFAGADFEILKKEIIGTDSELVIAAISDVIYKSAAHTPAPAVTYGGKVLVAGVDFVYGYSNNVNAGTGFVTVTFKNSYNGAVTVNFIIKPAPLTVTAVTGQTKVYGNPDLLLTYTASGWQGGDDITLMTGRLERAAGENAGTYAINLSGLSAGSNYEIVFTGANYTITKATLTITPDIGQYKVYGTTEPALTYEVSGWKLGDSSKAGTLLTGALTRADITNQNAGDYVIGIGNLSAGGNYNVVLHSAAVNFTINKAVLAVTAAPGQYKVYGGSEPALGYTLNGLVSGDTVTGALGRTSGETAGLYAINIGTLSAGGNYTITFTGANFEIRKAAREHEVTMTLWTWVYGGTAGASGLTGTPAETPVITYYYTASGGTFSSTVQPTEAGTYWVLAVMSETANYNAFTTAAVSFTITKAKVTAPSNPAALTYTGGALVPVITTGVPANDILYTVTVAARTNAGAYTATVSLNDTANYEWAAGGTASITLTWVINKVKVTAPTKDSGVFEFQYDGTEKRPDIAPNPYYTVTGNSGINVNDYTATVSLINTVNYEWTDGTTAAVTLTWKITKAKIVVPVPQPADLLRVYNGSEQSPYIPSSLYYSIAGNKGLNAGGYTAVLSLKDNDNYEWADGTTDDIEIEWEIAKLKVTKPAITSQNFIYADIDRSPTIAPSGYYSITGDTLKRNAGTYTVTVTLTDANVVWSDDSTTALPLTWEILKADRTNTVGLTGWTFGDTANVPYIVGAVPDNPSLIGVTYEYFNSASVSLGGTKPSSAGTYYIAAFIPGSVNYNALTTPKVMFIIAPEGTTPKPTPSLPIQLMYNGAEQSPNGGAVKLIAENANYTVAYYSDSACTLPIMGATVVGTYYAKVSLVSTDYVWSDLTDGDLVFPWQIIRADRDNVLVLAGWNVDATPNNPDVGTITEGASAAYTWGTSATGPFTGVKPTTTEGTYWVKAEIPATANYNAWTQIISFVIARPDYKITFNSNGGSSVAAITAAYNSNVSQPTNPAMTGYTFLGWYTDDGTFANEVGWTYTLTGNVTFYADWRINVLSITYVYNNGTANTTASANYDANVILPSPTREGYLFLGWSGGDVTNAAGTVKSQAIRTNLTATDQSAVLYAQWQSYTLTIVYNKNGGAGAMTDSAALYSAGVTVKTNTYAPPNEYLMFLRWDTKADGTGSAVSTSPQLTISQLWNLAQFTEPSTGDKTLTLYAVWDTIFLIGGTQSDAAITGIKTGAAAPVDLIIPETVFSRHSGADLEYAVTSIGAGAFANMTGIVTASIPLTVTEIGKGAFAGCAGLTEITVPFVGQTMDGASNTHFGYIFGAGDHTEYSFVPSSLETVTVLAGEIPAYAFYRCADIKTFSLPDGLQSIGGHAFEGCAAVTAIVIPDGVKTIGIGAFKLCANLYSIDLYDTEVTEIADSTFYGCAALHSIALNPNAVSIGLSAFEGCASLEEIIIPYSMETIGARAFYGCASLQSIDLEFTGVTIIDEYTFVGCSSLKDVALSQDTEEIRDYAFYRCAALETIDIPSNVNLIGKFAFSECVSLEIIDLFDNGSTGLAIVSQSAFEGCTSLYEVILPSNLSKIENRAFAGCTSLTGIIIPNLDVAFGSQIFAGGGLMEITMPFTTAADYADIFGGLENPLEIIFYSPCIDSDVLEEEAFKDFNGNGLPELVKITLPDDLKEIRKQAFSGCTGLASIIIPSNVDFIGEKAFYNCSSLPKINLSLENVLDLAIVSKSAFEGCTSLYEVILPSNLSKIEDRAFAGCTSLTEIAIPNNNVVFGSEIFAAGGLIYIKMPFTDTDYAQLFAGLTTSLKIEFTVYDVLLAPTVLSNGAFQNFNGAGKPRLINVYLPDNLEEIKAGAFSGCSYLGTGGITVSLANTAVEAVGDNAFKDCIALTKIILPDELETLGNGVFGGCVLLSSIELKEGLVSLGTKVFSGCAALQTVVIPNSVTAMGNSLFEHSGVRTVTMPLRSVDYQGIFTDLTTNLTLTLTETNIKAIPTSAFANFNGSGRPNLVTVYLPENLETIGASAFQNCTGITGITVYENVNSIGASAFYGCSSLAGIDLHANDLLTQIKDSTFEGCGALSSVLLPDDISYIGNRAFYGCGSLTGIDIPSNVDFIGSEAFFNCSSLTSIDLSSVFPTAVKSIISVSAFEGCTSLAAVELPSNLSEISNRAFARCTSLTTLYIPNNEVLFGANIFDGGGLTYIEMPFTDVDYAALFNGLRTELTVIFTVYPASAVTGLSASAFENFDGTVLNNLPKLIYTELPHNLLTIGNYAFSGCIGLGKGNTAIVIPSGVLVIPQSAFMGCAALQTIELASGTTSIGASAFQNSGLKNIYNINDSSLVIIGARAFQNTKLVSIDLSNTKIQIIDLYTFAGCISLENVTLPDGVLLTEIAGYAFYNCWELTDVNAGYLPNSLPASVSVLGGSVFRNCYKLIWLDLSATSVTVIPDYAFSGCISLEEIDLPVSVTEIGVKAFEDCESLSELDLFYISIISGDAFQGAGLTDVTMPYLDINYAALFSGNTGNLSIVFTPTAFDIVNAEAFKNFNGTSASNLPKLISITLPNNITDIGARAFENCSGLTQIAIPSTVGTIGVYAFSGCTGLRGIDLTGTTGGGTGVIVISEGMFSGCTDLGKDNVLLRTDTTAIGANAFLNCASLTSLSLLNTATANSALNSIGASAFQGSGLTSVDLRNTGVTIIPSGAFRNAKLTSIYLNTSTTSIGDYAFAGNTGFTAITVPNTVGAIGNYAFQGCTGLTAIDLSATGVTAINSYVFSGCTSLYNVILKPTTTAINSYAFQGCTALANLDLTVFPNLGTIGSYAFAGSGLTTVSFAGTSVGTIGSYAFQSCASLISVTFGPVTTAGDYAFSGCTSLSAITFNSLKTAGNYAFSGCTALGTVSAANVIESIGNYTFYNCTNLTAINLTSNLLTIGNNAFMNTKISQIIIPDSVTSVGNSIFSGCAVLNNISIPLKSFITSAIFNGFTNGVNVTVRQTSETELPAAAFSEMTNLLSIALPSNLLKIGNNAFDGCTGLIDSGLSIPNSVTDIGNYAFRNCTGLNAPALPSALQTIGSYAFSGCTGLSALTIPGAVTTIGNNAFATCTGLTALDIPASVTSIGANAFSGSGIMTLNVRRAVVGNVTTGNGNGINAGAVIFVYNSVLAEYRTSWTNHATRIFPYNPVLSFDTNGGSPVPAPVTKNYNDLITSDKPSDPNKTGYTFVEWCTDAGLTSAVNWATYRITDNITLYAKWTANQITITFDSNGGSAVSPVTGDYLTSVGAPPEPSKANYTFGGWYQNPALTTPVVWNHTLTASVTFYAKWIENIYTITLDKQDGSGVPAYIYVKYGVGFYSDSAATSPITSVAPPARTGYLFQGYYQSIGGGGTPYISSSGSFGGAFTPLAFSGNTTIYADWLLERYLITWDVDGTLYTEYVNAGLTPSYPYGTPARADTPQFTYNFTGWSPTVAAVTGAATYTATFSGVTRQYLITWFDEDGTTALDFGMFAYNTLPSTGVTPIKASTDQYSYTFNGWAPAVVNVAGAASYTAVYTAAEHTLTIGYDANGGSGSIPDTSAYYGQGITVSANGFTPPSSETFLGWNTAANGSGEWVAEGSQAASSLWAWATGVTDKALILYAQWG